MKKIITSFLVVALISCNAGKQVSKEIAKPGAPQVYITDWGKKCMILDSAAWNNAEKEIISQIGATEYATLRKTYDYRNQPPAMSMSYVKNLRNPKQYYENLSRLKVYKVGSFRNFSKGTEWGRMAILKVPFEGNENWDTTAKWDLVYFIIDDKVVKEMGEQ